jgi:hypothetical protein
VLLLHTAADPYGLVSTRQDRHGPGRAARVPTFADQTVGARRPNAHRCGRLGACGQRDHERGDDHKDPTHRGLHQGYSSEPHFKRR